MIKATEFLHGLHAANISFVSGTPCSYLKPLINAVAQDDRFMFVDTVSEGDAVSLASGAVLDVKHSAVSEYHQSATFIHLRIRPGAPSRLPRPEMTPDSVFRRLQDWLGR